MATIISSEVVSDRPQSDGRRYVKYKFVVQDNDGSLTDHFHGSKLVAEDFDTAADIVLQGNNLLTELTNTEETRLDSPDLDTVALQIVLNPKFSSSKKLARKLILFMMREKDPRVVIWLEPLIVYLRENYNANQIANFLNIPVDKVLKMNRRINAILSDVGSVKDQLTAFDVEEEEIE